MHVQGTCPGRVLDVSAESRASAGREWLAMDRRLAGGTGRGGGGGCTAFSAAPGTRGPLSRMPAAATPHHPFQEEKLQSVYEVGVQSAEE